MSDFSLVSGSSQFMAIGVGIIVVCFTRRSFHSPGIFRCCI